VRIIRTAYRRAESNSESAGRSLGTPCACLIPLIVLIISSSAGPADADADAPGGATSAAETASRAAILRMRVQV
jgi:hypothetical protein